MRRLLAAALLSLTATSAFAAEWQYEDLGIPIAYFDTGAAQFQFACRGGDLAMGFWVRAPHRTVAGATSMHLALLADPPKGADLAIAKGVSFAQDMPLIHSDGASMIVRGPVARAWARIAQKAKTTLRVAFMRKQAAMEFFDDTDFGTAGSSAAIGKVLGRCG